MHVLLFLKIIPPLDLPYCRMSSGAATPSTGKPANTRSKAHAGNALAANNCTATEKTAISKHAVHHETDLKATSSPAKACFKECFFYDRLIPLSLLGTSNQSDS